MHLLAGMLVRMIWFALFGLALGVVIRLLPVESSRSRCPVVVASVAPAPVATAISGATLVDVSSAVRAANLSSLVPLATGEHVIAVGDRSVDSDLAAGARIADSDLRAGEFLDLTIANATGTRRVLLLMH